MREIIDRLIVACDDGRVEKLGQGFTIYACISFDLNLNPINMDVGLLKIDGLEASSIIAYSASLASLGKAFVLLLDSLTIAGFNVISPATIMKLSNAPTIVVYNYKPSFERLYSAFSKLSFSDLRKKVLRIVDSAKHIETPRGELWILSWGMEESYAKRLIEKLQVHSRVPEPLRIAHSIASEASLLLLPGK